MIRKPTTHITAKDVTVARVIAGLDKCPVIAEVQAKVDASRGLGGVQREFGVYSVFSLTALTILLAAVNMGQKIANLMSLAWDGLTPYQLQLLRLDGVVTPERRVTVHGSAAGRKAEYARLWNDRNNMCQAMNPSPFAGLGRGRRYNRELNEIRARSTNADGSLTLEGLRLKQNRVLLDRYCNQVLGAFLPARQEGYQGHIVFDGTILRLDKRTDGTGLQDHLLHGDDPDAGWYWIEKKPGAQGVLAESDGKVGKNRKDRMKGEPAWAYEITLAKPTHSPYGEEVGQLITGFTVHSTPEVNWGGATEPALVVTRAHKANGHGPLNGAHADAIADRGYSNKDGLSEGLLREGYLLVQDYSNRPRVVVDR